MTASIPALGSNGREIYQAWRALSEGPPPPGETIVGIIPGEGLFGWQEGRIVRLYRQWRRVRYGARCAISTWEFASEADVRFLHEAIDRGIFQVERQVSPGAWGLWPKQNGGDTVKVLHQATGIPLPQEGG